MRQSMCSCCSSSSQPAGRLTTGNSSSIPTAPEVWPVRPKRVEELGLTRRASGGMRCVPGGRLHPELQALAVVSHEHEHDCHAAHSQESSLGRASAPAGAPVSHPCVHLRDPHTRLCVRQQLLHHRVSLEFAFTHRTRQTAFATQANCPGPSRVRNFVCFAISRGRSRVH